MSTIKKYIFTRSLMTCLGILMISGCLTACVDDNIVVADPDATGEVKEDGDAIVFTMELDKSLTTRDGESIFDADIEARDNWIDMQDKFRVFFFTENGDFLFGANDRIVGSAENLENKTGKDYWYVRIPMTMIVDRNNKEYDIAAIKKYLKTHKFKVAVLANWPNAGDKINPSDYDDSAGNSFKQNPSSTLKGEPLWSWENSVLNKEAKPEDIKNINDLHHIYHDTYYASEVVNAGGTKNKQVYEKFMNNYKDNGGEIYLGMGQPTDWVKMRDIKEGWHSEAGSVPTETFDSKETANQWIRAYWSPNYYLNEDKQIYRHYQHLWFLWNFNAIYNIGLVIDKKEAGTATDADVATAKQSYYGGNYNWNDGRTIGRTINKWGSEWWERNGNEIYTNWFKGHEKELTSNSLKKIGSANNSAFLEFQATNNIKSELVTVRTTTGNTSYGIKLPKLENAATYNGVQMASTIGESFGYFKFMARTSGTLRIRWSSADDQEARIVVQSDQTIYKELTIDAGNQNRVFDTNGSAGGENFIDISVTGESRNIYIWTKSGNAVIYAIEFIRGKYLYDTDREGVAPAEIQGIPMYGVQEFDPLTTWEYGSTINLPYNVSLIRALAKIEVYIPTSYGVAPRHVYMRSMNRTAHCEPMDVETNTSDLWNDTHDGNNCEWFNIQKYSPAYDPTNSNVSDYIDYLSWFYGSWKYANWFATRTYNANEGYQMANGDYSGWDFSSKGVTLPDDNIGKKIYENLSGYPHIFNPHINPSEYCSFIYVGEVTADAVGWYKYVLYMPEKFINDPTYPGKLNSIARVPHIEFRFPPEEKASGVASPVEANYTNDEFNLDNNDCYRIYFTNYGYDSSFNMTEKNEVITGYTKENFDSYEQSADRLKYHWPIMRNHVYQFYVSQAGPTSMQVQVKVTDWSHEKVVVDW